MVLILNNRWYYTIEDKDAFPSPCGDYGSYLTDGQIWVESNFPAQFPSPCGDYGSYRFARCYKGVPMATTFPSPCGDYGSYQAFPLEP